MAESGFSLERTLAMLSQARAFSHLPRTELEAIISLGRYHRFSMGDIILQEGLKNSSVYFLLSGSVSVYAGGKLVSRYGRAGDTFGEMSVVSGAPISTTVIANEDLEALVLDGPAMGRSTVDDDSDITAVFYKLFALSLLEKLRLTTHKASLAEDAIRRIAPQELGNGDLASQVQSVSRHLSDILLMSQAVHTAENGIVLADVEGRILRLNLAAESLFACVEIQLAGKPLRDICEPTSYQAVLPKVIAGQVSSWRGEMTFLRGTGQSFPAQCSISTILNQEGQRVGILLVANDITDKLTLQRRLAQAQNLETMGRMAGGIAHDINNLLQPIIGFAHLALADQKGSKDLARDLEMVLKAAARAKDMVAQLLLFSTQPQLSLEPVAVAQLLEECVAMARLQVAPGIAIRTQVADNVPNVQADATQLARVVINLAVNAGHAMPRGGTITVTAVPVDLNDYRDRFGTLLNGPYVRLSVADTGAGMDPATLERAFEPFF
ncbi:MAG TPA: cyclic nucleotide-binding domain-containing protein, partial [bacterium]|nr:cyclic nucleotide-binding domain-containing protein [bacterium]